MIFISGKKRRQNVVSAGAGGQISPISEDFDAAVQAFLRHCRIRNLTKETQRYYTDILRMLRKLIDVSRPLDVTREHIESAIEAKQREAGEVTINMYLRGWRAFFNWLHNEGYIVNNPMENVKLLKAERRVIQTFSKAQIKRLLDAPNRATFTGYRDYLLMLLLLDTGIRISEAEGIRITDIDWANRTIKVRGKGRKERLVPFQSTLERHLREYISVRGVLSHDFLFVNIDDEPMKKRAMQQNIARYGAEVGIKDVRVSPHTFRHTFAKLYVMNGGDPFSLQKILGHTSLDIVRIYVNLFGTDVAKQHAKFSPLERLDE